MDWAISSDWPVEAVAVLAPVAPAPPRLTLDCATEEYQPLNAEVSLASTRSVSPAGGVQLSRFWEPKMLTSIVLAVAVFTEGAETDVEDALTPAAAVSSGVELLTPE